MGLHDAQSLAILLAKLREKPTRQCLLYETGGCSSSIIQAHSVQNSFILDQLHVSGHVYMFNATGNSPFPTLVLTGRNKATVFTGFCGKHDLELFKDIDISKASEFKSENPRQACLYFLRATALEYWKKLNMIANLNAVKKGQMPGYSPPKNADAYDQFLGRFIRGHELGLDDLKRQFESLLWQVRQNKFHLTLIKTVHVQAPCRFAVSAAYTPDFDFNGNVLFDRRGAGGTRRWPGFMMHVLPMSGQTIVQFGAHKHDRHLFERFCASIDSADQTKIQKAVSRTAVAHSENIVISPARVNLMTGADKENLNRYFTETMLFASDGTGVPDLF